MPGTCYTSPPASGRPPDVPTARTERNLLGQIERALRSQTVTSRDDPFPATAGWKLPLSITLPIFGSLLIAIRLLLGGAAPVQRSAVDTAVPTLPSPSVPWTPVNNGLKSLSAKRTWSLRVGRKPWCSEILSST